MTTANSLFQSIGALSLPLDAADFTSATGLTPLDPGRAVLTALFKAAINDELGAAWARIVATLPTTHRLFGTSPVEDTFELEPTIQNMQQRKTVWPLLCVHRTGEGSFDQITLFEDRLTQQWSVDYILGPLDVAETRQISDVCVAVAKVIRMVIRQRGHKSYQDGALQFFSDTCGFAGIELKSLHGPGQAKFAGDESGTLYHAITLTLETVEKSSDDLTAFGPLESMDAEFGVGGKEAVLPGLIYGDASIPVQIG